MKMSYADWLKKVDQAVSAKVGLSYRDLADQPYRSWYDSGVSPKSAAARAVRSELS